MKKLYIYSTFIFLSLLLFTSGNSVAQTITISGVPTNLCANESFSLNFVGSGYIPNTNNVYTAEISDIAGNFTTSTIISNETFSTSLAGTVYVTIPANTTLSPTSNYRIRVFASSTNSGKVTSANNGAAIIINCTTRDYYWIGGTGNWSDISHWEYTTDGTNFTPATEPPQPDDNANFDDQSFPSGGTLKFDQFVSVTDFFWEAGSGANNPAIESNWNGLKLSGELVIDAGVLISFSDIEFNSTKENIEINMGDNALTSQYPGRFKFYGGGSWDLNSEMTASGLQISNGSTFYTNGYMVDLSGQIWADGPSNTLATGNSDIFLNDLTSNDMTILGSATWHFKNESDYPRNIGRNVTLDQVIIEMGEYQLDGNNTFNDLQIMPGGGILLRDIYTTVINSSFTAIGTRNQMVSISSSNSGQSTTLTIGTGATVTVDFAVIQDNNISGPAGTYLADNSIDNGNTLNWTFNAITALDYYWVGGTGNWSDNAAHWGKLAGGGGFRASPPGPLDNVFFTTSSFPSGGEIRIDIDAECNDMIWEAGSGATNPKLSSDWGNALVVHGDFTIDNGVNRALYDLFFESAAGENQNLNFGDNITDGTSIIFQGGGTWNLQSDMTGGRIELRDGTFNSNGYKVDVDYLYFYDITTSNWANSIVNIYSRMNNYSSSLTMDAGTSTFNFTPKYSNWDVRLNGPFILYNANFSGKTYIYDNNGFNNLTFLPGAEVTLPSGNTQSIAGGSFSAMGLRDQPITIKSSNPGTAATIAQGLGTVNTEYLIIEDITVGSTTFNTDYSTYNGATYSGGAVVSGWTFNSLLDPLTFYWVGGTGNWSDFANHWSQADGDMNNLYSFAPGPTDDVIFTANSFSATGQVVTLDNSVIVNNMTWMPNSGNNSPTITYNNQASLTIHGNLIMDNGVQRNLNEINFDSPNANNIIDMADNQGGINNSYLYFRGGGSWDQQGAIKASYIYIYDATFNSAGFDLDINSLYLSDASAVVNLGSSNVYLNGLQDWSGGSATLNAGSSTIIIDNSWDSFNITFTLNNVTVKDGGQLRVDNNFTVNNLTLEPGSTLTINSGNTLTTGTFGAVGTSAKPIRIKSNSPGQVGYISQPSGAVNAQFLLISDNDAQTTGSATFSATNSIDAGNTGGLWLLTQPVPKSYYWVGGSGNWSDVTHWADADNGTTNYATPPGIADNVFFTSNSFSGSNETVVIDQKAFCNNMTWTTTTAQSPTLFGAFDLPLKVFGSFILADGVHRNIAELIFESYNPGNQLDFADNLKGSFARITFKGTGSWSLLNDFEAQDIRIEGGTFNSNDFTLKIDRLTFSNNANITFNAGASDIYASRLSNYTWNNNLTFNKGTSTVFIVKSEESYNSIQGPFNLNMVEINVDTELSGSNSFATLMVKDGVTLELNTNNTQIVGNLQLNGLNGSPITLNSNNPGTQGTFSVPSTGTVIADYVIIQDNNATGGASFAATNSSEISNVTGWTGLKKGQTISFPILDDIQFLATTTLTASASSGLPITYQVVPITGSGNMNSDIYAPASVGLVGITATQAGDATYGAAAGVTQYIHANLGELPNELGQMKQASYVVGAPNGVTTGSWQISDKTLINVTQAIVSPDGKLIAGGMGRVLIWDELPDAYDVPANVVVGQADFTSLNQTASRSTLGFPNDIFTGGVALGPNGELIVADGRGVLIWQSIPTTNGVPADVIIGQTNFTDTDMAAAQNKFKSPLGVAVSPDGKLIVSDISGHRVLIFNSIPTSNGANANFVIGQDDFTSSSPGISQTKLAFPGYVTVAPDGKLFIADLTNNRVLVYNSIPTTNGAPADAVIGQPDFNSNSAGTTANTFRFPMCVAVSRTGKIAISDWENNRVLIFNSMPANSSTPADLVLGQPDFTTNGFDDDNVNLRTMAAPFGVAWDQSENLLITDTGFDGLRRIMVYGAKDLEPPVIAGTNSLQPYYTMSGGSQVSTITATDRSGIASGKAFWQEVNQLDPQAPQYEETPLTDLGNGQFQFDLSVLETKSPNPTGIVYYVELTDNAGNSVNNATAKQKLPVYYPNGTTLDKFGVGSTQEDYRLMATPLVMDNGAIENVFTTIYDGDWDKSKMRIFSYPGGTGDTYTELLAGSEIVPGKGYFALAKAGSASNVTSPAGQTSFTSTPIGTNEFVHEFKINLVQGWNLIGNPFLYNVSWSDILSLSGLTTEVETPQTYNGTGYADVTSIPKGEGIFIFANSAVELRIPAKVSTGGRIKGIAENTNPLSESSWEIMFKAKSSGNEFNLGGIGMEEDADFSKDVYDKMNPPAFGNMKTIVFNHPEYYYPSFKKDIRESSYEEKWEFEYKVDAEDNSEHTITWDNSYFGDDAPDIFLVDKTHFTTINMQEQNSYTFKHGGVTKFEVYYGDNALQALLPEQVEVQTPFPNPFREQVSINVGLPQSNNEYKVIVAVYNTMGKQVATLTNANMASGYYNFNWMGANDSGTEVPNGIYAYRVIVEGEVNNIITGKIVKQ